MTASTPPHTNESQRSEFSTLVAAVDQRLRRFVLTLTSNPDDAEDVLQDSYEIAWRRFADFQEGTNFYQWISRIAFNQSRNFNRRRRRHHGLGLSDEVLFELAKVSSGYSEFLEVRQQLLQDCLQKLKPVDRALLMDAYRSDQPKSELVVRYGIRFEVLYKKLFRLRVKLYECVNSALGRESRRT